MTTKSVILFSGSGSRGHTVPLIPVIEELQKSDNYEIHFVGAKNDPSGDVLCGIIPKDNIHFISTGKFRRYANQSIIEKLTDVRTFAFNVRDAFRLIKGLAGARGLVGRIKPDIVFTKGGSVCVPVAKAAQKADIPLITHDSDTTPSLASKIAGSHAVQHLVGSPFGSYPYDKSKTIVTGVPISRHFESRPPESVYKQHSLSKKKQIILVTGGSLGALKINRAMSDLVINFSSQVEDYQFIIVAGRNGFKETKKKLTDRENVIVYENLAPIEMAQLMLISDLVISRAGATTIYELAASKKPTIIIPAPQLQDQMSNANMLSSSEAAEILHEKDLSPGTLLDLAVSILSDKNQSSILGGNIAKIHNPDAAKDIALVIKNELGRNV